MPASNTNNQERLAAILGRAIRDESFAAELHRHPANAAKDLGMILRIDEVVAFKGLDIAQLAAASKILRSPLEAHITFDQQRIQMD
ncbi:Os1348 family NHLP clan protein [Pseudomonas batumici]|uniref:Os1348 family NHLP clan protein n=1 Tax=Pseudomonas batumici TaxID=226910 RepID=UPI0030CB04FC